MSVRVYALARGHNILSKDVVEVCGQLGIEVKSHMSAISEEDAARVIQALKKGISQPAGVVSSEGKPAVEASEKVETLRREDYMPPSGVSSKVPDLDQSSVQSAVGSEKKKTSGKAKVRPRPKVQGALRTSVPASSLTKPEVSRPDQPMAQKPQMRRSSPGALRGAMKDKQKVVPPPVGAGTVPPRSTTPRSRLKPLPKTKAPAKDDVGAKEKHSERPASPHSLIAKLNKLWRWILGR